METETYLTEENFIGKNWLTFGLVTKIFPNELFIRRIFILDEYFSPTNIK